MHLQGKTACSTGSANCNSKTLRLVMLFIADKVIFAKILSINH